MITGRSLHRVSFLNRAVKEFQGHKLGLRSVPSAVVSRITSYILCGVVTYCFTSVQITITKH